jgi:hypothetical protein
VVGHGLEVEQDVTTASLVSPGPRKQPPGFLGAGGGVGETSVKTRPVALGKCKSLDRKRVQFQIGDPQVTHAINPEQVHDASAYRPAWLLAIKAISGTSLTCDGCQLTRGAPDIPKSSEHHCLTRCTPSLATQPTHDAQGAG